MFAGTQLFFGRIILDYFLAMEIICSMSFSRELKVSHWCCTSCPGYSCNYSFGRVGVQLCVQGDILNWCIIMGPNVMLPSFLLLPDFTKTSPSTFKERFGLAAVSFPSCVGRNDATAATRLRFVAWSDQMCLLQRVFPELRLLVRKNLTRSGILD